MLAARANDGSATADGPYTPGPNPGDYQPTPPFDGPPFNGFVAYVNWGKVTPFVLRRSSQFRAPPPYKVTDLDYTFDLNEIKALGSLTNSVGRTDDQTQLAIFWYESSGPAGTALLASSPRNSRSISVATPACSPRLTQRLRMRTSPPGTQNSLTTSGGRSPRSAAQPPTATT